MAPAVKSMREKSTFTSCALSWRALTQDRKKSSIGRKLAALKGFFRYLLTTHKIAKNPLLTMHSPKQEKPLPAFLSVDDVFQLLGAIQVKTPLDVRDRAALEVFYSSGLRVSELVGLDWADIDFQLGILRVVGKGSKERIVPVGEIALQALRDYAAGATKEMAGCLQRRDPGFLEQPGSPHYDQEHGARRREAFETSRSGGQDGTARSAP